MLLLGLVVAGADVVAKVVVDGKLDQNLAGGLHLDILYSAR